MTALHAAPAGSPVRTRRADRTASTRPRNNAPVARRPRDAVWAPVATPAACSDVVPEREVSFAEFAASFAFVDAATGRSVDADSAADLDTVRVVRRRAAAVAAAPARATVQAMPMRPAAPVYTWTPRGLAVLLALVLLVTGVVAATVVSAFLAVSPEPLSAGQVGSLPLSITLTAPGR